MDFGACNSHSHSSTARLTGSTGGRQDAASSSVVFPQQDFQNPDKTMEERIESLTQTLEPDPNSDSGSSTRLDLEIEIIQTKIPADPPHYLCEAHFVGKSVDDLEKIDLIPVPQCVLKVAAKFPTQVDPLDLPFQRTLEQQPMEDNRSYLQRRAVEVVQLLDYCYWLQQDISITQASLRTKDVVKRMCLKTRSWFTTQAMNERRNKSVSLVAPSSQGSSPSRQKVSIRSAADIQKGSNLYQHRFPDYSPVNKPCKEHLLAIQGLGYSSFKDLPIIFHYYEPSLPGEMQGDKNSRQQSECSRMDSWLRAQGVPKDRRGKKSGAKVALPPSISNSVLSATVNQPVQLRSPACRNSDLSSQSELDRLQEEVQHLTLQLEMSRSHTRALEESLEKEKSSRLKLETTLASVESRLNDALLKLEEAQSARPAADLDSPLSRNAVPTVTLSLSLIHISEPTRPY